MKRLLNRLLALLGYRIGKIDKETLPAKTMKDAIEKVSKTHDISTIIDRRLQWNLVQSGYEILHRSKVFVIEAQPVHEEALVAFGMEHTHYNWSHRWFLVTRGKLLVSRGFIQKEATFWRRSLWEKTGRQLHTGLHYAGDLELWSRFYLQAIPVTVDVPLAMFRVHQGQKTSQMDLYISEANRILSNYPRPIPVPAQFIRLLNKIYQRIGSHSNWLGARCDQVTYNLQKEIWVYQESLEWRDYRE